MTDEPTIQITGRVAAAPEEYGPHAVVVLLDAPIQPRKFRAGESVTLRSGGLP